MILKKFLKNILELLTGLQFDICYVILKQDLNSKLQKLQDFKTILGAIHLLFKVVIDLTVLENSQGYLYREVICL